MSYAMEFSITIFLILGMASVGFSRIGLSDEKFTTDSVLDYGAVGDGKTDDSQAFLKAWNAVCGSNVGQANFVIEKGKTFLLKPVSFQGPCKSPRVHVQIQGTIVAPETIAGWGSEKNNWLVFSYIDGLIIDGNGSIDGKGSIWWQDSNQKNRPDALSINSCNNLKLSNLNHINSPGRHVVLFNINGGTVSNLNIRAPQDSPNTDGIDFGVSTNIQLHHCNIQTGDDCIAIGRSCSKINISNVECGPGHGISIGSLGAHGSNDEVEEIHVRDCSFTNTQNGARIKTWQGGAGFARKISFEGITLNGAGNPIFIDQYYCPHSACSNQSSAVDVSDISFTGVRGTTITKNAINLSCSKNVACTNVKLQQINITSANGQAVAASCTNAHGRSTNTIPSVNCLLN